MDSRPRSRVTTSEIDVGDVRLAVAEHGAAGPQIVMLHGIGSSGESWWPVIDALAERARLIVPDLRGHGASQKPASGYLVPDYARDLDGLLVAYSLDRPIIVGHSLGGLITLHWARHQPARAAKLLIEDAPLVTPSDVSTPFDGWIALASMTPEEAAAKYAVEYPHWSSEDCLRRARTITSVNLAVFTELRDSRQGTSSADPLAPFASIQSDTMLIYGDVTTGGMLRAEDAERFAVTLPNARAAQIVGGTHSLHRDNRDEFLRIAEEFLFEN